MRGHEAIPLEGRFNCWNGGFDLPDLLLVVCETGRTGLLRFASAEGEKAVFVRKGEVVFASSSSEDDRLGEVLLREGKISLRDLSKHTHLVRPGKRLGTLLVESGVLDPKELVQAVIGQVRAIVLSLFRWTEARYGFDEQELPSKETITLNMPTARLIMDGVQMIDSWRRISQGVGGVGSVYRRVEGNEKALRKLNLDTSILEVLAILGEAKSVAEICDSSPLPDIQVCRHLWAFRCLGWVEAGEASQVASTPEEAVTLEGEGQPVVPAVDEDSSESEDATVKTMALKTVPVLGPDALSRSEESTEEEDTSRPVEGAPASASLVDLEETPFELVSGDSSELSDASESKEVPGEQGESDGIPVVAPELVEPEGELSLEIPGSDSADVLPLMDPQGGDDAAAKESSLSDKLVLDTEDGDLEGLGMVLGEERKEREAG